ncbi:hypothetical protein KOI35_45545 [Actinoplanes bogorensis]|uniref:Signal transduction histidine kinase subgroup 3 dimerisation and phosphoacceptor domain-containing protein n=1 Tax=Paractinoplanes bogorensis TaxID=1610840 RepID=A0ABS5Z535_9ACTN|nr:histidine kinase [Actinoplanes bogorensis]MBU2670790.1 hypothetical protein [Actinoplanes bogorensis]
MRSQTDRFELYIKGTLYSNVAFGPLLVGGAVLDGQRVGLELVPVAAALVVHLVLCVLLMRAGIAVYPGRGPLPVRLIVAGAVSSVVAAAAGLATYGQGDSPAAAVLIEVVVLFAIALSTLVRPMVVLGTVGIAGIAAIMVMQRDPGPALVLAAILLFLVPAARVTLWTLGLVRELDEARRRQARLAVAEERLRISRDLHDVLGRTLSVVALKAELSARLVRRGRPEAADEMLEVRRIAQDALTEVRAVVAGYRAAGLSAELAGARSLLESAGITTHVEGAGIDLPADVQEALGWVVREGTTNVLRHSEAGECHLTLRTEAGQVTLTMVNDGVAGPPNEGTGLTGLTERIAALGGTVTATRIEPGRFQLRAEL